METFVALFRWDDDDKHKTLNKEIITVDTKLSIHEGESLVRCGVRRCRPSVLNWENKSTTIGSDVDDDVDGIPVVLFFLLF